MYRESKEIPSTETKHPCLTRWRSRIDWAEENGGFHVDHKAYASRWDMCAVGEAHASYGVKYHRNVADGPIDSTLERLGMDFYRAVDTNRIADARSIIAAIEQRLAELAR